MSGMVRAVSAIKKAESSGLEASHQHSTLHLRGPHPKGYELVMPWLLASCVLGVRTQSATLPWWLQEFWRGGL